jgi:predicted nucleotidyltransferase
MALANGNMETQTFQRPDPAALDAARVFLARASRTYDIVGARLYGSRARGDYRQGSDIDLAVFLRGARKDKRDMFRAATDMGAIAFEVLDQTEIWISALPVWEEEWAHPESYRNPRLLENIRREGVPL